MNFFTMTKFAAIVCLAAITFGITETAAVRFPLMHIYSECSPFRPPNRTWESLISQLIKADASRLHFLKRDSHSFKVAEEEEANVPVQSAPKIGEYVIQVDFGTQKQSMYTLIDTGSDLAWIPCKQCQNCDPTAASPFDPTMSSSYESLACDSEPCQQGKSSSFTTCGMQSECEFDIEYGSGSQIAAEVSGVLSSDTITLGSQRLPNFSFGCAEDVSGEAISTPGLMGLGGGPLSLLNQPTSTELFGRTFSYCLPILESSASPGSLVLGKEAATSTSGLQFTTLLKDPSFPTFYYVNLQRISVGDTVVSVPTTSIANGGGTFIDSGTMITRLVGSTYTALRDAFRAKLPNLQPTSSNGLETCYDFSSSSLDVPTITLHLDGNVDLVLRKENIVVNQGSGLSCLAFLSTDSGRSIIGNIQQQNWRIVFDVANSKVGFMREQCASA